jgi:hypothetical protein
MRPTPPKQTPGVAELELLGISHIMQSLTVQRHFWIGAAAGCLLAIGLNLLPYLRTRGAYQTDGLEVIGFPVVFRSLGGFAYRLYFSWWALLADILFAIFLAFALGLMWSKIRTR